MERLWWWSSLRINKETEQQELRRSVELCGEVSEIVIYHYLIYQVRVVDSVTLLLYFLCRSVAVFCSPAQFYVEEGANSQRN